MGYYNSLQGKCFHWIMLEIGCGWNTRGVVNHNKTLSNFCNWSEKIAELSGNKICRNRFIYEKIALLTNVGSFLVHDIRATSQNGLDIGLPVAGTNSCQ